MPIPAELRRTLYGPKWRNETRPRILKRAGNRCEQCNVPNYTEVKRHGGAWLSIVAAFGVGVTMTWRGSDGGPLGWVPRTALRTVRIVLTVAHLNHVPGDDRDENLKALCQWCHLNYDKLHHAETRAVRKDLERPLLRTAV